MSCEDKDSASGLSGDLIRRAVYRRDRLAVFDRILPRRTAVLVLNMQNAWLADAAPFDRAGAARAALPRINRLVSGLRGLGAAVFWFQHTVGAPGTPEYWSTYFDNFIADDKRRSAVAALTPGSPWHALGDQLDRLAGDVVLSKYRFSAFMKNPHDLEALLRAQGIDTVVVAGTATNVCCESTIRDAMMRGFRTFMPHDAVAAPTEDGHLAGLRSVMQTFADVRPIDEIMPLASQSSG